MEIAVKSKKNSLNTALSSQKKLTSDNYYHDKSYMDVSSFKPFLKCEAAGLAQFNKEWEPQAPKSGPNPLILGNFIHSYFQSKKAHQEYITKDDKIRKEIFKYGKPEKGFKKDYATGGLAANMIETLARDEVFNSVYMPGDKEVIVTGEIGGRMWKGKIDSLSLERGLFCDLKTVDNIHKKHWVEGQNYPTNFIIERGYVMQIAIYQELIYQTFGKWLQPFIFAVSKQDPPDHDLFDFDTNSIREMMEEKIKIIEANQKHIFNLIAGKEQPLRCEQCAYCRKSKQITHSIHITDIELD